MSGEYRNELTAPEVNEIKCESLYKENKKDYRTFCNKLMEQMNLRSNNVNNYVLIYAQNLNVSNLSKIEEINAEIADYATKYKNKITKRVLFLLDTSKHVITYLYYDDTL